MINSMTGFGRASTNSDANRVFTVEIRSVNHRYLDLNIKSPKSLFSLEERIRKIVSSFLNRGKVDVFITYKNYSRSDVEAKVNLNLADSYYKALNELRNRYDVKDDLSLSLIARFPEVIYTEEKEESIDDIWLELETAISSALDTLKAMRIREGEKLKADILDKCDNIIMSLKKVEVFSHEVVNNYKVKLINRLEDLLSNIPIDENRISLELALFADKASIDEEITRLYSHIDQLKNSLESKEPIGRKLDFIVQEMNREANTIASKSADIEITNIALNIKNDIEKIREQIQNIE